LSFLARHIIEIVVITCLRFNLSRR